MEGNNPSPETDPRSAYETALQAPVLATRLLPLLRSLLKKHLLQNFEGFFVLLTFIGIALILYFIDQKLSFLNFYFIPILLAGYFMNTRSAVLGSLLSILVVTFFVVVNPDSFYQELTRMGLYLHLVTWGSFLILTGATVGRLTEQLRSRFFKASETLARLADMQEGLSKAYKRLEERNLTLEANKTRVEAVLNSTLDPLLARLIIEDKVRNESRDMSVLHAELVDGAGRMEALPAESLVAELNRAFSTLDPVFTRFGGHLDRYSGRGLTLGFGVPLEARRHSLLAALAGVKMQERLAALDLPWKLRIGVASGRCLVALVGSESRRNFTVMGPAVDRAAALASSCPPGGVLTDGGAFEAAGRWFHSTPVRLPYRPSVRKGRGPAVSAPAAEDAAPTETHLLECLKDPLEDPRLPRQAAAAFRELSAKVSLPLEMMLPIEAREGAIGRAHAVAALAAALARALGLDERPVRTVFLSAFLHDIGKNNVPERLLEVNEDLGGLTSADRELVRSHVEGAQRAIDELGLPSNQGIVDAIRQHHERFDGSGYPEGLKGTQICLEARIIALAEAYDKLTLWRPGYSPLPPAQAVADIDQKTTEGVHDPRIADVFLRLLKEGLP